jgi:microcystin-dependent protein
MEPILGEIRMFAGDYAPVGWALCDGRLLKIYEYDMLFALLDTTYGGDGIETFGLPDLRGRAPLHNGAGPGVDPIYLGQIGGNENVTIQLKNVPPHSHPVDAVTNEATSNTPGTDMMMATAGMNVYVENKLYPIDPVPEEEPKSKLPTLVAMNPLSVADSNGGSKPVSIVQPYLAINFIIALTGIFPPRN